MFSEAVSIQPDNKTITIHNHNTGEEYEESYDSLVLSMGADAAMPPIPGIDSKKCLPSATSPTPWRSRTYNEEHQAKKAVVAGGGFIGLEVTENLRDLGMDVTLVEMADQVIPSIDADMAAQVHGHMRQKGLHLLLGSALQKIEDTENRRFPDRQRRNH